VGGVVLVLGAAEAERRVVLVLVVGAAGGDRPVVEREEVTKEEPAVACAAAAEASGTDPDLLFAAKAEACLSLPVLLATFAGSLALAVGVFISSANREVGARPNARGCRPAAEGVAVVPSFARSDLDLAPAAEALCCSTLETAAFATCEAGVFQPCAAARASGVALTKAPVFLLFAKGVLAGRSLSAVESFLADPGGTGASPNLELTDLAATFFTVLPCGTMLPPSVLPCATICRAGPEFSFSNWAVADRLLRGLYRPQCSRISELVYRTLKRLTLVAIHGSGTRSEALKEEAPLLRPYPRHDVRSLYVSLSLTPGIPSPSVEPLNP